jgi:hypothetical protein
MAGRCLGELVRKMGDRILAQIIPILRDGMASPLATTRQVRCAAVCDAELAAWLATPHLPACEPHPAERPANRQPTPSHLSGPWCPRSNPRLCCCVASAATSLGRACATG